MTDLQIKLPTKEQLLWPTLVISLLLGGGSGVGVIDRWMVYLDDQETQEQARHEAFGRLASRVAENARQNQQEWTIFSQRINHLNERVATVEGKSGIVHPHAHPDLPVLRPEGPTHGP